MVTVRTLVGALVLVVAGWLFSRGIAIGTLPPADFRFSNGADIKSVDPAIVTGQPEGRIIYAIFEGLYRNLPASGEPGREASDHGDDPHVMVPQPAMAERCDISTDGLVYTFFLRPEARWSDGTAVTAHDFAWSWKRFLHPETPNQYVYQLASYVSGAQAFNTGQLAVGDRVEVELADRPRPSDPYPAGTPLAGILRAIHRPKAQLPAPNANDPSASRQPWIYDVEVLATRVTAGDPLQADQVNWDAPGTRRLFAQQAMPGKTVSGRPVEVCMQVLPHFDATVGIRPLDSQRLEVRLAQPTSYFLELCGFYVLYPVHRPTVEKFGYPHWAKPENLVCNGPYQMAFRRIRDRIRLRKNPHYWNHDQVQLETIDALAVSSQTTILNMYLQGQIDWMDDPPQAVIPELRTRHDWHGSVRFGTYFYRLNTTKPPLDNPLIRRALNQALDKEELCRSVVRAGELPARSLVPPGIPSYVAPACAAMDVQAAQRLLAEAGFPEGRGFPRLEILYNTNDNHRTLAEVIQQQWSRNLGIEVELKNREWQVYLNDTERLNYHVSRAGWIGDYTDPNTFLDMFVSGGPNNMTGWASPAYDEKLAQAKQELDTARRFEILREAEQVLLEELPIIPIYYYASKNLVRPTFEGFHENLMDVHPLHLLRRKESW